MSELAKPCPFCGGPAVETYWLGRVGCARKDCAGQFANQEVAKWNLRAPPNDYEVGAERPLTRYPRVNKPWTVDGHSFIHTHCDLMQVSINNGRRVNDWTLQMICDGVNFLARSWAPEIEKEAVLRELVALRQAAGEGKFALGDSGEYSARLDKAWDAAFRLLGVER